MKLRDILNRALIVFGNYFFAILVPFRHVLGYVGNSIALLGIILPGEKKPFSKKAKTLIALIIILSIWGWVLSLSIATRLDNSLLTIFTYIAHWLLPFLMGYFLPSEHKIKAILSWILALLILGLISLVAYVGFFHAPSLSSERLLKGFHSHIQFGSLLLIASHLLLGAFFSVTGKRKYAYMAGFIISIVFIILTGSRGVWLATSISMGIALIYYSIKKKKIKLLLFIGISLLIVAVTMVSLIPGVKYRVNRIGQDDPSYIYRYHNAILAYKIIRDNPLTGIGPGQVPYVRSYYDIMEEEGLSLEIGYKTKKHVHCMFNQIAVEFGLPGLILFLGIIITAFSILLGNIKRNDKGLDWGFYRGILWAFIGILLGELLDCLLRGPAVAMETFWLIGIMAGSKYENSNIIKDECGSNYE